MVQHVSRSARTSLRTLERAAVRRIAPVLLRWWENPLLRHARRAKPLPWRLVRIVLVILSLSGAAAAILAWVNEWRLVGGLLMGLSVGGAAIPLLEAPVASANRVAHQMQHAETDPRLLVDLAPGEVAWGLVLVTLWHLRWPIVFAIAVTPALMIGTAHASVSDYRAWQESAQLLGAITPAGSSPYLPADGEIPYFRVAVQALSAGLLPLSVLVLLATSGITAALYLEDTLLSSLSALLVGAVICLAGMGLWFMVLVTPLLSGRLEVARFMGVGLLMIGTGLATKALNHFNIYLLSASQ